MVVGMSPVGFSLVARSIHHDVANENYNKTLLSRGDNLRAVAGPLYITIVSKERASSMPLVVV